MFSIDIKPILDLALKLGVGAGIMFILMQKCMGPEFEIVNVDSSSTSIVDTNMLLDSGQFAINKPTIIDTIYDTINNIKWYRRSTIHDTISDTMLIPVYIPTILYSDTIKEDSLNAIWYSAKVQGELKKITVGFVNSHMDINTLTTVKVNTTVIKLEPKLYIGVRLNYDLAYNNINRISMPFDFHFKNGKTAINISPAYNIKTKAVGIEGGVSFNIAKQK
jgi:3D (Asp-Asp-Asp) domain-containing protein|tara:strand:- start:1412 stop:2071 length:660 start_codon:yes stop_codon:yes gene_type:complete